jgi:hypothetical protein
LEKKPRCDWQSRFNEIHVLAEPIEDCGSICCFKKRHWRIKSSPYQDVMETNCGFWRDDNKHLPKKSISQVYLGCGFRYIRNHGHESGNGQHTDRGIDTNKDLNGWSRGSSTFFQPQLYIYVSICRNEILLGD